MSPEREFILELFAVGTPRPTIAKRAGVNERRVNKVINGASNLPQNFREALLISAARSVRARTVAAIKAAPMSRRRRQAALRQVDVT